MQTRFLAVPATGPASPAEDQDAPAKPGEGAEVGRRIDLGDVEMGRRLQQFPGGPLAGINMVQFP